METLVGQDVSVAAGTTEAPRRTTYALTVEKCLAAGHSCSGQA